MNTQKIGTTKMDYKDGQEIIIRRCTEPNVAEKQIYEVLKYQQRPYCQKKFVVPPDKFKNYETIDNKGFRYG